MSRSTNGQAEREETIRRSLEYQFDLEILLRRRELALVKERLGEVVEIKERLAEVLVAANANVAAEAAMNHLPITQGGGSGRLMMNGSATTTTASTKREAVFAMLSTGTFIRWTCPECKRTDFSGLDGFKKHCRYGHSRLFSSMYQMVRVCGVPVDPSEVPANDPCRYRPLAFIEHNGDASDDVMDEQTDAGHLATLDEHKKQLNELVKRMQIKVFDENVELSDQSGSGEGSEDGEETDSDSDNEGAVRSASRLAHVDAGTAVVQETISAPAEHPLQEQPTDQHAMGVPPAQAAPPQPTTTAAPRAYPLPQTGSRFYVKKSVIVGNTSRFITPENRLESHVSHKWMMYVCGPANDQNVRAYLSKVRFYLHPSYAPDDIVDVVEPPFTLKRYGWGEFPVRVQLFFRDAKRNKPIDIVHMLKLSSATRQVLGDEKVYTLEVDRTSTQTAAGSDEPSPSSVATTEPSTPPPRRSLPIPPPPPPPPPPPLTPPMVEFDPDSPLHHTRKALTLFSWTPNLHQLKPEASYPDILFLDVAKLFPIIGSVNKDAFRRDDAFLGAYTPAESISEFGAWTSGHRLSVERRRARNIRLFVAHYASSYTGPTTTTAQAYFSVNFASITTINVVKWCRSVGLTPNMQMARPAPSAPLAPVSKPPPKPLTGLPKPTPTQARPPQLVLQHKPLSPAKVERSVPPSNPPLTIKQEESEPVSLQLFTTTPTIPTGPVVCKLCGLFSHTTEACSLAIVREKRSLPPVVTSTSTSRHGKRARIGGDIVIRKDEWNTFKPLSVLLSTAGRVPDVVPPVVSQISARQRLLKMENDDEDDDVLDVGETYVPVASSSAASAPSSALVQRPSTHPLTNGEKCALRWIASIGINTLPLLTGVPSRPGSRAVEVDRGSSTLLWKSTRHFLEHLVQLSLDDLERRQQVPQGAAVCLTPAHVHRALARHEQFDFLTNENMSCD